MSSNTYTLPDLVDLALQTPEIGSVNFNILRIVLRTIIFELNLEGKTATWSPNETGNVIGKILDAKDLPDHPIFRQVATKQKKIPPEKQPKSQDQRTTDSDEKTVYTSDASVMTESETLTETGDEVSSPKTHRNRTFRKKKGQKQESKASKGLAAGANLWFMWQMKKLVKRMEAVEEEMSSLVDTVDELKDFKETRMRKTMFEDGGKMRRSEVQTLGREEFEDVVDELGEALSRIAINQRKQKDECNAVNEGILMELSLKVSMEELARNRAPLNKRLRSVAMAVKSIQDLIKEVIYPQACAVTKCMACGRKSHLPFRCKVIDPNKISTRRKDENYFSDRPNEKKEYEEHSELRFTKASMARKNIQGIYPEVVEEASQEKFAHPDDDNAQRAVPEYIVNIEPFCDMASTARNFAPLRYFPDLMRRNTISIPTIRPQKSPVSISVLGNDDSEFYVRRYGRNKNV